MDTDQLIRRIYQEGYEIRLQNVEAQDASGKYLADGAWVIELWENGRRRHEVEEIALRDALQLAADWIGRQ